MVNVPLPQIVCFTFCDEVQVVNGKYCILGVFYRIFPPLFPYTYNLNIVMGWYGEQGMHHFDIILNDPHGQPILMLPAYRFELTLDRPYVNVVLQAQIPLHVPGNYHFIVYLNDELYGEYPLQVVVTSSIN
ncbi:hypothetical protein Dtox_3606 [Desulfofarcimen acetoxidans DSM 771]|jgi:hypothetical protein|uniref:Uncharacterized protein n=1 Tax=Desulfofarcimen acetoxidans (strain ATCC 49208 / DSM 771 / KCTC 5769 / VKM B-1644 / 5575) TaxID=485916 RepID=C8VW31_DESAS|nr:hypothetical protein [Desulfofarcimen acetoxidans]ACV64318.1 hypothetical protein Dtox_3606 [Desulfofarcimen acetoxidans DSM 771]